MIQNMGRYQGARILALDFTFTYTLKKSGKKFV